MVTEENFRELDKNKSEKRGWSFSQWLLYNEIGSHVAFLYVDPRMYTDYGVKMYYIGNTDH